MYKRQDHHSGLVDVSQKFDEMHGGNTLPLVHELFEEKDALIFENCEAKSATPVSYTHLDVYKRQD